MAVEPVRVEVRLTPAPDDTAAHRHAEILYRNAVTKARIISRRQLREFMRGDLDVLPCSGDTERNYIKAALARMCALARGETNG